ncbi:dipeptidase [Candidatus Contubernalis alkalaceticus]|nr:dipeptidase [Candidatus Contubernalis alkalaceticus]
MIADCHCDSVYNLLLPIEQYDFCKRNERGHVDIPRFKETGMNIQVFALFVEQLYHPDRSLKRCLQLYELLMSAFDNNNLEIELATSQGEIDNILNHNKIAALLAVEGGECLEGSLDILRLLYRLGVRILTLTWNHRNQLADGVMESQSGGGLTTFGREVVKEMNSLKMIIDVSHLSEGGFWDVIELSECPVIASHSNANSVFPHVRNLKEEQIKALAQKGGIMGINFYPGFIGSNNPGIHSIIDHIDYLTNLVGIDYLCLGGDFDGIDETPEGLEDVSCLNNLTSQLLIRGYEKRDVEKIMGENFYNFFQKNL